MTCQRQGTVYVSAAETGKLIRAALKRAFPSVTFAVRTEASRGGGAARVQWTDGPTAKQVHALLAQYEGASFDGMIDLETAVYQTVDGQRTHYGTSYIFTRRVTTRALVDACLDEACAVYGQEKRPIRDDPYFGAAVQPGPSVDYWDLEQIVTRYLADTDATKRCSRCGYYLVNTERADGEQPAPTRCRACREAF